MKTTETQTKEFYVKFFVDEVGDRMFLGWGEILYFTKDILDSDIMRFYEKDKDEKWYDDDGTELQTLPVKIRYEIEIG